MIRIAIAEDNQLEKKKKAAEAAGRPDLNVLFICNMPFRAISKMTAGAVDGKMVEGMVDIVNGHFFVGAGKIMLQSQILWDKGLRI